MQRTEGRLHRPCRLYHDEKQIVQLAVIWRVIMQTCSTLSPAMVMIFAVCAEHALSTSTQSRLVICKKLIMGVIDNSVRSLYQ